MYKVGITGGIGSGKTTIAKIWQQMGAYVLFADDFAKKLMVEDEKMVKQIKETFGDKVYYADHSLNREYLGKEAFEKGRVEELNSIVHPRVFERTIEKMKEAEDQGYEVFVKEAALLLKYGRPESLDKIVLVLADEDKRSKRVAERDKISVDKVKHRIDNQQDFKKLRSQADFVIYNNGTLDDLKMRAEILYQKFHERAVL